MLLIQIIPLVISGLIGIVFILRHRQRLYVDASGIRIRTGRRSRTLGWDQVRGNLAVAVIPLRNLVSIFDLKPLLLPVITVEGERIELPCLMGDPYYNRRAHQRVEQTMAAIAARDPGPGAGVPGRNGGHGLLHTLMGPTIVVRVAHEAGQLDPLALHRDDGQEERLQVEDAYKVSQRDDGDGEVAAHLVPAQRPGPPPRADADPTGVHVQTLTMAQDEDNPDEAADHQGDDLDQQHDRPDAEPVVGPLLEELF